MAKVDTLLERARPQGYIVARRNAEGQRFARYWWAECSAKRRPYVRVTPRQRWASVELDMATTDRDLSQEGEDRVYNALLRALQRLPSGKRGWFGAGNCSYIPALPLDEAETLAAELLHIATDDLAQHEWVAEVENILAKSWPGEGLPWN